MDGKLDFLEWICIANKTKNVREKRPFHSTKVPVKYVNITFAKLISAL